jgi:hypothetical protein
LSRAPALALLAALTASSCTEEKGPRHSPRTLTTRARGEGALVVDRDFVFWIDRGTDMPEPGRHSGKAWRVRKAGSAPKLLAENLPWPRGLAQDERYLYWASFAEGRVLRLDKDGGQLTALVEGEQAPRDVAVDGSDVYFVTGPGEVKRVSKTALDATRVFWLTGGATGALSECSKSSCKPRVLARGVKEPGALVLDDASVYWTDRPDGLVLTVEKDGGSVHTLVRGQWDAARLALGREHIYWQTGERLFRVAKAGGKAVPWGHSASTVVALATDARTLYWLDGLGSVQAIDE